MLSTISVKHELPSILPYLILPTQIYGSCSDSLKANAGTPPPCITQGSLRCFRNNVGIIVRGTYHGIGGVEFALKMTGHKDSNIKTWYLNP